MTNFSFASAIVDIIALGILILFAVLGAKNGFVKTFLSSFGSIISLLLAVLLCTSVARYTEKSFEFVTKTSLWLNGLLSKVFGNVLMNTTLSNVTPEAMQSGGIAGWLIVIVLSLKNDGSIPTDVTLSNIICPVFAYYLVCILAVIGLFVIFKIICFIVGSVVKSMHSIRLVSAIDVNLGWALGLVRAIVFIQFAIIVCSIIPLGFFQDIIIGVENSILTSFINKINLFSVIVKIFANINLVEIVKSVILE
ncbi:MAG: CvpA family protein [Clostridia bacterium]|nr:CvpA family protein [Clostridia bacterium]